MQQVYPWEEAEPQGLLPGTQLRPYQKQSLAFMLDVERSTDPQLLGLRKKGDCDSRVNAIQDHSVRGGLLCDESECPALVLDGPGH